MFSFLVCSTTLWVGHLSKLVYQEELSDTFGEYGDIISIDQIVPRGCAFIVMNRRQDAYKAMQSLKNHKLQGRAISISWAAGKGVKSKEWKDFWDLELGVTFIPWNKLNDSTDFDSLEEGGMFDEDSMPSWMKDKINKIKNLKEKAMETAIIPSSLGGSSAGIAPGTGQPMIFNIDTTQPPPLPPSAQSGGTYLFVYRCSANMVGDILNIFYFLHSLKIFFFFFKLTGEIVKPKFFSGNKNRIPKRLPCFYFEVHFSDATPEMRLGSKTIPARPVGIVKLRSNYIIDNFQNELLKIRLFVMQSHSCLTNIYKCRSLKNRVIPSTFFTEI